MKITRKILKQLIEEELNNTSILTEEKEDSIEQFTDYEEKDISTDEQVIQLLKEIVAQLKLLNYTTDQPSSIATSAADKAQAAISVAEEKNK
tara:strand:+ start:145 stop:420 length:276 start_codon:yes stop_codon:yes gene_type:complete